MKMLILALLLASCSHQQVAKPKEQILLIEDVTLISPELKQPRNHTSVLIRGERIAEIGEKGSIRVPDGAQIISGTGKYLIPGLIDAHVHLASVPGVDLDESSLNSKVIESYYEQLPKSYLYFGFTTLIDLAAVRPKVLSDFRARPIHPDLYDCGSSLPIANGYPMGFLPPKIRFKVFSNFIYDPSQKESIPDIYTPEEHTPESAVKRVKDSGGICVKTYWEKGFGRKMSFPVPSQEALEQIASASEKAGLVTLVHANSLEAQEHVVGTGINIIAHGLWNWGPLSKSKGLPPRITKLLDEVVSRKIGYMPTMQVIGGTQALSDPKFLDDPNLARILPRELVGYYRSPQGKWFRNAIEKDEGVKLTYQTHMPHLSRVGRVAKYLAERNAKLLFGTDTPASPTYGNPPGYNGYLEMKRWFSSGVSLKQILHSATLANAQAMRLDSSIGTVEKGKLGNLVLLQKNPYDTVEAYDHIDMVILRGKPIPRTELEIRESM